MSSTPNTSVFPRQNLFSAESNPVGEATAIVEWCLQNDIPVQCMPLSEEITIPTDPDMGLNFVSPNGTFINFGNQPLTDEQLSDLYQTLFDGHGVFFDSDDSDESRVRRLFCFGESESRYGKFSSLADFDERRSAGEFIGVPDLALASVRDSIASCSEEAKCHGTLGPICVEL